MKTFTKFQTEYRIADQPIPLSEVDIGDIFVLADSPLSFLGISFTVDFYLKTWNPLSEKFEYFGLNGRAGYQWWPPKELVRVVRIGEKLKRLEAEI